jgi:hypothetical protein
MALIMMPADPKPVEIKWRLKQPTQVNRSEWTGRRKVTVLATAPRWTAQVTMPPLIREKAILPWRVFLARCMGQAHTFRLVAVEGRQQRFPLGLIEVDGGGQTGFFLNTRGWTPQAYLTAGRMITVGDQLLHLTEQVIADASGRARLPIMPYLRGSPPDGSPIEAMRPYAVMAMSEDENGWDVGKGQQYSVSFNCEEAY